MRQSCCFCLPLLWEEWITFLLQTQSTQIGTPGVKSKKERKKDLKAASFQSISSFFMMYYLWQGVDGSLSGLPVCFIKAVSLLSRFNDKQHASSHILLPATLIIRVYLHQMQSNHFSLRGTRFNHLLENSGVCFAPQSNFVSALQKWERAHSLW